MCAGGPRQPTNTESRAPPRGSDRTLESLFVRTLNFIQHRTRLLTSLTHVSHIVSAHRQLTLRLDGLLSGRGHQSCAGCGYAGTRERESETNTNHDSRYKPLAYRLPDPALRTFHALSRLHRSPHSWSQALRTGTARAQLMHMPQMLYQRGSSTPAHTASVAWYVLGAYAVLVSSASSMARRAAITSARVSSACTRKRRVDGQAPAVSTKAIIF